MRCAERRALGVAAAVVILGSGAVPGQGLSPVQRQRSAMGTVFDILAYHPSPAEAARVVDAALAEVVRLDGILSHYDADSDLSRLNREGSRGFVEVPPELFEVVAEAARISRLSGGAFDASVAPVLRLFKEARETGRVPTAARIAEARACVGSERIELAPPSRIRFRSDCLELDLGAIGKGYAVDRAMNVLRSGGVVHAVVDGGGSSIAAAGAPPGHEAWPVALSGATGSTRTLLLRNAALSTSAQAFRRVPFQPDAPAGDIIDPHRAEPVGDTTAVTVVAARGVEADALSTTLLLLGPEAGAALLEHFPSASALWTTPAGALQASTRLSRLQFVEAPFR